LIAVVSVTFVLPGLARRANGGYRMAYHHANYLASHGHSVHILHMRASWLRSTPFGKKVLINARYLLDRRRGPSWFPLSDRVIVRNYAEMRACLVPPSDAVVATSVATAALVNRATIHRKNGVYLIQGLEDFTLPREQVFETWGLPMVRVVVSSWLQDLAKQRSLASTLIENGVDTSVFAAGDPTTARRPSVLAMVSEHVYKRTDLVTELMRKLANEHPDVALTTFGTCQRPDGLPPSADHWRNPSLSQLVNLYQQSQVYVCTSDFEGFGLPALEAMACGCAVVSTENGGVPAFAGQAAAYVARGSAQGLFQTVIQLLSSSTDRLRLVEKAAARATELSLSESCRGFEEVILRVAS
jgi:glycosyltransferase involved in cell wall biosynthesis